MYYRIIATNDIIGKDDVYLSDAETTEVSDEVVDSHEKLSTRLHELADSGDANSIEVIFPDGIHGNCHVSFYHPDHPYAEVEHIFSEIDDWIEKRKNGSRPALFSTDCDIRLILEHDGEEIPF